MKHTHVKGECGTAASKQVSRALVSTCVCKGVQANLPMTAVVVVAAAVAVAADDDDAAVELLFF